MTAPAENGVGRWLWRGALLAGFAALAYALSLAATAPARVIERFVQLPAQVEALGGTVWNGEARLAGGHRMTWAFDLRGSAPARALRFDVTASGPETRLSGHADLTPAGARLFDVTGRAGWSLVRAFAPDITVECSPIATVDLQEIRVSRSTLGARGTMRTPEGTCSAPETPAAPVPALLAVATMDDDASRGVLSRAEDAEPLAEVEIEGAGWLRGAVFPAGARLVPGLPSGAPMTVEVELPAM